MKITFRNQESKGPDDFDFIWGCAMLITVIIGLAFFLYLLIPTIGDVLNPTPTPVHTPVPTHSGSILEAVDVCANEALGIFVPSVETNTFPSGGVVVEIDGEKFILCLESRGYKVGE